MSVKRPSKDELAEVARSLFMTLSDEDSAFFLDAIDGGLIGFDAIEAMPDFLPPVEFPRSEGRRPTAAENGLNAWYVKTEIRGAQSGKLAGKT